MHDFCKKLHKFDEKMHIFVVFSKKRGIAVTMCYQWKENEIKMVQNQNEEMKSEMQFMITEYEKIKTQNDKYQQGLLKFNQLMNLSFLLLEIDM